MPLIRLTMLGVLFLWLSGKSARSSATPLIALREAQNCGACHNPGRSQRPFFERRCTLDCQGCHTDPTGGGGRNQWGYYYSIDQLPMYSPYKPIDPLLDESRFDLHIDTRRLEWIKPGGGREIFPMAMESSIRLRPFIRYLNISYSTLMLGRLDDKSLRIINEGGRRFREKYAVMLDNLPLNAYVRAYRGTPMYGIKRPNHTLWIRERLGLDQFATTEAYEMGATPNVPFFRFSKMLGDPYAEESDRQKGSTYHAGLRGVSFGWHLNTSAWDTQSLYQKINMTALGAGASLFNVSLYGERNWRHVRALGDEAALSPLKLHPSSAIGEYTLAYQGIKGLSLGLVKEEMETLGIRSKRDSIFFDVHPIPWLQFEVWRRKETLARSIEDTLAVLHLYADF
ncbi:MAG: hypothetical protein NTX25_11165 [Proteobacteria bacterium]|nr:hypothetical protein [Pseudomonadota bacterium]